MDATRLANWAVKELGEIVASLDVVEKDSPEYELLAWSMRANLIDGDRAEITVTHHVWPLTDPVRFHFWTSDTFWSEDGDLMLSAVPDDPTALHLRSRPKHLENDAQDILLGGVLSPSAVAEYVPDATGHFATWIQIEREVGTSEITIKSSFARGERGALHFLQISLESHRLRYPNFNRLTSRAAFDRL